MSAQPATANWYWNPTRWGGPVAWARQYDRWVATDNAAKPVVPSDWTSWRFWQTPLESVAGIAAAVDADKAALIAALAQMPPA